MAHKTSIVIEKLPNSNQLQNSIWKCLGRILTVLLFLLIAQINFAQGFLKVYKDLNFNHIRGVLRHDDNGYFSWVADDSLQYWLLDNKGNIIEKHNLQTPENTICNIDQLFPSSDGNYLVRGYNCLTKINTQGDSIWYKNNSIGYNYSLPNGNLLSTIGTSLLCPNGNLVNCYGITMGTLQGDIIADTSWLAPIIGQSNCWNALTSSSIVDNETALLVGTRYDYNFMPYIDVAKVSLSNFGDVLWRTVGPVGISFDAVALSDGSYLLAAGVGNTDALFNIADSLQIIKYSANGNVIWQKNISLSYSSYSFVSGVHFLKNEQIGESILIVNNCEYIIGIDSSGTKTWEERLPLHDILLNLYAEPGFSGFLQAWVIFQEDNSYLISGRYPGEYNLYDTFLARIDSTGSCRPQAAFSLVQTDSLVSVNNTSFGGDRYTWLWGDGAAAEDSTEQAQQYIYPQTGSYSLCLVAQNLCGSDTLCQTVNHFAAGIGSLAAETSLLVSPNPANQQLSAHFAALRSVGVARLYGSTGQLVAEQTLVAGSSQVRFATQALPSGVYVLMLSSADWAARQRVVLRH